MSARDYAIKRLREFGNTGLRVVDEETVLDAIIAAVREECCSGELKWEPIPGWIDPISIKPSESNQSWHRQMFDVFVAGISKKECAGCVSEHFSKSEPSCLKPGCKREQHINANPPEPQLIQGYTAEQWQEIKEGGYLCEFSDDGKKFFTGLLVSIARNNQIFQYNHGGGWTRCRPAQIKGVMRPIFVEPVDKDGATYHFYKKARSVTQGTWNARIEFAENDGADRYIEL